MASKRAGDLECRKWATSSGLESGIPQRRRFAGTPRASSCTNGSQVAQGSESSATFMAGNGIWRCRKGDFTSNLAWDDSKEK